MSDSSGQRDRQTLSLIDEIAFYRDLVSDVQRILPDERKKAFLKPLKQLETEVTDLLFMNHDVKTGQAQLKVAVVGLFSSGKSSFINSLLGEEICPTDACPTTSSITRFTYGAKPRVKMARGTQREEFEEVTVEEYSDLVRHPPRDDETQRHFFAVEYPFAGLRNVELYDTPGFGNPKNPFDTDITKDATKEADILFVVLDVNQGELGHDLLSILEEVHRTTGDGQCYLILNKADTCIDSNSQKVKERALRRYSELFDGAYLYSSTGEDAALEVERLLEELAGRARTNVEERDPFVERLRGEKQGRRFVVSLNGHELKFTSRRKAWMGQRSAILELFDKFAGEKRQLLVKAYNRAVRKYGRRRENYLRRFLEKLERERKRANGDVDELEDRVGRDAIDRLTQRKEALPNYFDGVLGEAAKATFWTNKIPKEQKWYLRSPYYKVFYRVSRGESHVRELSIWRELTEEFERLGAVLEKDFGFTDLAELSSNIDDYKKSAAKTVGKLIKAAAKNRKEHHSTKQSAEKWIVEVATMLEVANDGVAEEVSEPLAEAIEDVLAQLRRRIGYLQGEAAVSDEHLEEIAARTREFVDQLAPSSEVRMT